LSSNRRGGKKENGFLAARYFVNCTENKPPPETKGRGHKKGEQLSRREERGRRQAVKSAVIRRKGKKGKGKIERRSDRHNGDSGGTGMGVIVWERTLEGRGWVFKCGGKKGDPTDGREEKTCAECYRVNRAPMQNGGRKENQTPDAKRETSLSSSTREEKKNAYRISQKLFPREGLEMPRGKKERPDSFERKKKKRDCTSCPREGRGGVRQ